MADSSKPQKSWSPIDPTAQAALEGLLGSHWLYLKSDDRLIRIFHALVRIGFKTRDGRTNGTSYIVHRNDERVVVIALSEQGLPFCYMSNDLLVAFDPRIRGRLLVRERGNPSFVLGADSRATGLRCEVSYETRAKSPYVMLDIAGILRSAVENLTTASRSSNEGSIDFATSRATGSIEFQSDEKAAPPLKALAVLEGTGSSLAL